MKPDTSKKSTRQWVLQTIKSHHQVTIEGLATAVGVSAITVRHHINSLLADGLIVAETVRHKVGRPHFVYHLSDKGLELFPKKYFALSSRLLVELKQRFSAEVVGELFESLVRKVIEDHRQAFEKLDFEARLNYVVGLLAEEGFLAKWENNGENYRIIEYSCPFIGMGQQHSEICSLDTALIEAVMETKIDQHQCMLKGDDCCHFTLTPSFNIPLHKVTVI